jgi:hypothetical protein
MSKLTQQEQEALDNHFIRCHIDYPYFARTNHRIQDENNELVPFILNDEQKILEEIWSDIVKTGRMVRIYVLKGRKQGVSTWFTSRSHWMITARGKFKKEGNQIIFVGLTKNQNMSVIAHDPKTTAYLFEMCKRIDENVQPELAQKKTKNNGYLIHFKDDENPSGPDSLDSTISVGSADTKDFGSGMTLTISHRSELAKWPAENIKSLLTSLDNAMPAGKNTAVLNESTAKGIGGEFQQGFTTCRYVYEVYQDENQEPQWKMEINEDADPMNEYSSVFIPWFIARKYRRAVPENFKRTAEEEDWVKRYNLSDEQLLWYRWALPNKCGGDRATRRQEYPNCISGRMRIGTNYGIIPLQEIHESMVSDHGIIKAFIRKGYQQTYKLTTYLGYEIIGTEDHPISLKDGSFVVLKDCLNKMVSLQQPEFSRKQCIFSIPIDCLQNAEIQININEDFARFVGYYMGDGSFHKETLSIVCDGQDLDTVDDVVHLFRKFFGEPGVRKVGNKKGGTEIRLSGKNLKEIFKGMGLTRQNEGGTYKRNVHVPEFIWRSPKPIVKEFLKGLFEADVFCAYKQPRISLFSQYNEFLKDIQILLLGFGIVCRNSSRPAINGSGYNYTSNTLDLRKAEVVKFIEEIGFVSSRKISRQESMILCEPTRANKYYRGRLTQEIEFMDEVVSIVPYSIEPVYDLSIDGEPVFGANGILVHNCAQEAFISSGEPAFDVQTIMHLKELCDPPIARYDCLLSNGQFITKADGALKVWKEPEKSGNYVISADVSEGLAHGDFHSADVLEHDTGEQVAHYHGKMEPWEYASLLIALGNRYNEAWLVPEKNNHGQQVIQELIKADYPNIYMEMIEEPPNKPRKRFGWVTTGAGDRKRQALVDHGKKLIYDGNPGINDPKTYEEMLNFKRQADGKERADNGTFDDCVMSWLIGQYVRESLPYATRTRKGPVDTGRGGKQKKPNPKAFL